MKHLFFIFLFVLFAAIGGLALTSCVSSTPVVQYPADTSIAMVYSYDNLTDIQSSEIPPETQQQLDNALAARNLKVQPISFASAQNVLSSIRDTERRLNALQGMAGSANYMVLTEVSTEFYSPLSGRYRWDVHARMTIIDMRTHETLTQSFTLPAVLMYSHENGADAVNAVKVDLERKLTSLVDQFLKGLATGVQTAAVVEAPKGASPGATRGVNSENKAEAIYFIMVDRFFNAQKDQDKDVDLNDPAGWHGGDLEGVRQKLPYLREMGVTQIWLSPVFTAASEKFFGNAAFHGYWTYDLNSVDTHFGTADDLTKLAQDAEKQGIGIILDFVVNHVGYGSPLVQEKPNWFHPALTIEDWNDPIQLTTREVHGLPDLDQDNPEVYNYLLGAATKWLSLPNITGYRLDAVKHVDISFWKKFNTKLMSQKPGMMLLGEYYDGDPKKVDEVQKNGKFTHLFDFPLAFALRDVYCDHKSLDYLANIFVNDQMYSNPENMVTFIDNHDLPRFISTCNGDSAAMERALNVMMSLRGVPSLYYGTEVPLAGAKEPENRGDMQFNNPALFNTIKAAIQRRSSYPVLQNGKTGTLHFESDFIVVGREKGADRALILISESSSTKSYTMPDGNWVDADNGVAAAKQVSVSPKSVRIFVSSNAPSILKSETRTVKINVPKDGNQYAVVGSAAQVGQWSPDRAPRANNGVVTLQLPAQSVIAYKLVRINNDGSVTWADGANRAIFTEKDSEITANW